MARIIWRFAKPTKRGTIALIMVIVALGRLGVYEYGIDAHYLPGGAWAAMLLLDGIALWATAYRRKHWYARIIAGIGAGVVAGLAWSVWPSHTSALILAALAYALLGEAAATHDC